jgi:1-deoxy-D-xylulose-5-phosphate synthase
MLDDAAGHPAILTIEDGLVDGGAGESILRRLLDRDPSISSRVKVLGVPKRYLPHGKADTILAQLGLDAAGLESSARSLIGE